MAKKRRQAKDGQRLGDFAEDLGRLLGKTQVRAQSWMKQREAIAAQLVTVRDTASHLLNELGDTAGVGGRKKKRGTAKVVKQARAAATRGAKRVRKFTRAQRLAQSRRMKAYWTKVKKSRAK
jgi:ElaB/YqjD/DUF883 family membrane-anchored ribosome-binding protein